MDASSLPPDVIERFRQWKRRRAAFAIPVLGVLGIGASVAGATLAKVSAVATMAAAVMGSFMTVTLVAVAFTAGSAIPGMLGQAWVRGSLAEIPHGAAGDPLASGRWIRGSLVRSPAWLEDHGDQTRVVALGRMAAGWARRLQR